MWVRLLLNAGDAARGMDIQRMHVDIREQLSSLDVRIMQKLHKHADGSLLTLSGSL